MSGVEIINWNPRVSYRMPGTKKRLRVGPRVNNFGDLLGPIIADRLLEVGGLRSSSRRGTRKRLLTVGSIMHFAQSGDTVWGTGVNGKVTPAVPVPENLDVRAVRGPLTREYLLAHGVDVPPVYGDPALLLPALVDGLAAQECDRVYPITVIPNLNDLEKYKEDGIDFVDPRSEVYSCLRRIARSEFVTGSSLHAIIVAEALGIPARLVKSDHESELKYLDYYLGSGRGGFKAANSVKQAVEWGGEPSLIWKPDALKNAFPSDLWV